MATSQLTIRKYFRRLKDPRRNHRKRHLLIDIISIAVCAVIGGATTWTDIATFGRRRQDWFARFLELPNGIPSHDTFERVLDRLDPVAFQQCLAGWLHAVSAPLGLSHIAIDGKTLRHSGGGASPLRQLQLVSAWATEARLTLGQVAVDADSNEITAIPKLLEVLDLHGALVSIDALGCQKEIAQQIVAAGGDYVLTVKGNQEHLQDDIVACFIDAYENDFAGVDYATWESTERGHGRHEHRVYQIITNPSGIRARQGWPKLQVIGSCYSERTVQGKTSCEQRWFIGSRRCSARRYGQALRGHWGIENNLHWQMDVTFGEDDCRIQRRHGAQNFAALRRLALTLLQRHPAKASIRSKRYQATLDVAFLEEVLTQ